MTYSILQQINFCSEKRFTGQLCITTLDGKNINDFEPVQWKIYFYRGRLVGESGGIHPVRRLRRQFSYQKIDLPMDLNSIFFRSESIEDRNYYVIKRLLSDNYLEKEQSEQIIVNALIEILFDILQYEVYAIKKGRKALSFVFHNENISDNLVPSVLIKTDVLWDAVNMSFQLWQQQGFLEFSPNLTPRIDNYLELNKLVSTKTYEQIVNLVNGQRTIRDISVKISADIEQVMTTVFKYYQQNVLSLQVNHDIDFDGHSLSTVITDNSAANFLENNQSRNRKKLVAHLGDNDAEVRTIEYIVQNSGHDYINLQESSQALMAFLRYQPDLILIDNLTTKFDSNNLCGQLRRTAKFKNTPIIFLSGNDGMKDWMRHKMINATECIAKPLSHQKIFTVLDKYMNQNH